MRAMPSGVGVQDVLCWDHQKPSFIVSASPPAFLELLVLRAGVDGQASFIGVHKKPDFGDC